MVIIKWLSQIMSLMAVCLPVYAHPGHDHTHWTSDIFHGVFFIALVTVAIASAIAFVKITSKKSQ